MRVGTAYIDITPKEPISIAGHFHVRLGEYIHDPLTVNAVAFVKDDLRVVIVSCDLALLSDDFIRNVQSECGNKHGVPAASVLIACTHTHLAPVTMAHLPGTVEPEFMNNLHKSLVDVVGMALADAEEVEIYSGKGWIDQMGFNRRGLHHGGKADMYYGSWKEGFEGVEGPRDGEVGVIFAKRANGDVKFVIPSFSTHPNSVEGECYFSADLVGSVRIFLRRNLGDNLGVVYLTGAAGNTAPSQLENNPDYHVPWRDEEGWKRSGLYLGSEILKIIAGATVPMHDPVLILKQEIVKIPIRDWPEALRPNDVPEGGARDYFTFHHNDWPRVKREESPIGVHINVLRLGDAVICTNPGELYVEHGLAIKKDSPAGLTIISELTDGYVGYIPTKNAFLNGGYCTWPAPSSKLDENAGDIIAANTSRLIKEAF